MEGGSMNEGRMAWVLVVVAAVVAFAITAGVIAFIVTGDDDDEGDGDDDVEQTETATATEEEDGDETPSPEATETPTSTPDAPAATALDAVGQFIEDSGQEFAGLCSEATEEQTGQMCAEEAGTSGNQTAFNVGPTFSEFTDVFFVRPEGAAFVVDHIEPVPCRGVVPCPPPVGATVQVVTTEGCVNARSEPSINSQINQCVDNGTQAALVGGPVNADARTWIELEGLGWMSAGYIECVTGCG
jgi:hypothetical protein